METPVRGDQPFFYQRQAAVVERFQKNVLELGSELYRFRIVKTVTVRPGVAAEDARGFPTDRSDRAWVIQRHFCIECH